MPPCISPPGASGGTGAVASAMDFEAPLRGLQDEIARARRDADGGNAEAAAKVAALERRLEQETAELYAGLTPWQKVQVARHPERPYTLDYLRWACSDFVELHGDRRCGDDAAIVGGPAFLDGRAVMVVGHQKGRGTRENVQRNFGMAHPEGYRKAQRLFLLAESLALPVITFVDTPGAAISVAAEERGLAESIAGSIATLAGLRVPVVAVVIGEGGSGGALAIAVADCVLMLEHAIYSVASPEAAAAILWRSATHAPQAAAAMGITAQELLRGGVIDGIIPEPPGGAHHDHSAAALALRERVIAELDALLVLPPAELLARRYEKYRHLGPFTL
jgi:acetyl-CoA carboxylase carboxyl transferase subunit alpha